MIRAMAAVSFSELVAIAQAGGPISFPTDTVPALAARPDCAAVIYALKQRDPSKPLILMGATAEDLWPFVTQAGQAQGQAVAQRYWPGALTMVLAARPTVPPEMNAGQPGTLGLRVPASAVARAVLAATGPLATTSVNRSGDPPLRSIAAIGQAFPSVATLTPQAVARYGEPGGASLRSAEEGSGLPSTVVVRSSTGWQVLRQGSVVFVPPHEG